MSPLRNLDPEVTLQRERVQRADMCRDLAASEQSRSKISHCIRREICTAMHTRGRVRDRTCEAKAKICGLDYSGGLFSADAVVNDCLPLREHCQDDQMGSRKYER